MKILITGCSGFIGFHLSLSFLRDDIEVFGLDNINDYYDTKLKYDRLEQLKPFSNFSFKKISTKVTLKLTRKSMGHTLEILSNIIKHPGQIVLLGVFFNPQIIAYVSTCKTLFYFSP